MIKTFTHPINGENREFCATLGDGAEHMRAIISTAASPETLVIMEASGAIAAIKARLESPETFLDDAIRKAKDGGLIEKAVTSGAIQNGDV